MIRCVLQYIHIISFLFAILFGGGHYKSILKHFRPHGGFYLPRLPLKFMTVESSKESIKSTSLLRKYMKPKIMSHIYVFNRHLFGDMCFNMCHVFEPVFVSAIHSIPSYA